MLKLLVLLKQVKNLKSIPWKHFQALPFTIYTFLPTPGEIKQWALRNDSEQNKKAKLVIKN